MPASVDLQASIGQPFSWISFPVCSRIQASTPPIRCRAVSVSSSGIMKVAAERASALVTRPLFIKTYPKSGNLYVDTPLNPEAEVTVFVAVFKIFDPFDRGGISQDRRRPEEKASGMDNHPGGFLMGNRDSVSGLPVRA